ncbi:MAG: hypothetical protein FWE31_01795 [Firmicutes bacterium]|nr:hypothetical protein [Bacillota bacterium]
MKSPVEALKKFVDDFRFKKHVKEVTQQNTDAWSALMQGEMTHQEADYIGTVVIRALGQQSQQAYGESEVDIDEMTSLRLAHNDFKENNPKAIHGIDTFGLVAEALSLDCVRDRSDCYEEIRDHGTGSMKIRVISDMVKGRHFDKMLEEIESDKHGNVEHII